MKNKYIIFDLDDTLTYEINFLRSAYEEIASFLDQDNKDILFIEMINMYHKQENVFDKLANQFSVSIENLLERYRNHVPNIILVKDGLFVLNKIKSYGYSLGLITDGRSVSQRNKLKALEIEHLFDKIIISEEFGSTKPNINNYLSFMHNSFNEYFYIGDNPRKDFVTPNKLGWKSICLLDAGFNIHKQDFDLNDTYLPNFRVKSLIEVLNYI